MHPYQNLNSTGLKELIPEIQANLTMCTLYRGKPYGLAKIEFSSGPTGLVKLENRFEGIGVFTDG